MSYVAKGRNVIHNGNFNVWQRGTSFTSPGVSVNVADRWWSSEFTDGTINLTQDTGVPNLASMYSMKVACTGTDATIAAGQYTHVFQVIEVQDYWDMLSGKPMILSFWVKSYQTGIFCVALKEGAVSGNPSYVAEYTINASATWEKKIVQIPATATPFSTTANGPCVGVRFALACGSTYQTATPNVWTAANVQCTANQVNFMSSTDNYIQFSQVQLEAGTAATEFDALVYADELARCQRYLVMYGGTANEAKAVGLAYNTTIGLFPLPLPVEMRAIPAVGYSAVSDWQVYITTAPTDAATITVNGSSPNNGCVAVTSGTYTGFQALYFTAKNTAARLYLSAEI